ncbi:MAG: hypothetical protein AB1481_05195 [Candidatus Omnitrophota bacterium]
MDIKKIKLPFRIKRPVLGLGGHTKNTVCFAKGNYAYLSRPHPDLANLKDLLAFEKDAGYFLRKKPRVIAYDLHPEYQSTKFALSLPPVACHRPPVQHHHAHIASCMAENGLANRKVIGVAFDGTGLGENNALWGGEFLICDYRSFTRLAHLKEVPLLGGERAILQPWRVAGAWLGQVYKEKLFDLPVDLVRGIDKEKWRVLKRMHVSAFNCPLTSSMGRLFDAVGSLVLSKLKAGFEAELAISLEKLACRCNAAVRGYDFSLEKNSEMYIINPAIMFKGIIRDLAQKAPKERIAYSFHLTVAEMISRVCIKLRKKTGLNLIVLSGGVFQNNLLLNLSLDLLYRNGFTVARHKKLSSSDLSLSLGQAAIANAGS